MSTVPIGYLGNEARRLSRRAVGRGRRRGGYWRLTVTCSSRWQTHVMFFPLTIIITCSCPSPGDNAISQRRGEAPGLVDLLGALGRALGLHEERHGDREVVEEEIHAVLLFDHQRERLRRGCTLTGSSHQCRHDARSPTAAARENGGACRSGSRGTAPEAPNLHLLRVVLRAAQDPARDVLLFPLSAPCSPGAGARGAGTTAAAGGQRTSPTVKV